jgi:hypothetical protein
VNPNAACPQVAPGTDYPDGIPVYFSRNFLTTAGVETSDTSGFFRNYFLTEPRIYGASVRYSFGLR